MVGLLLWSYSTSHDLIEEYASKAMDSAAVAASDNVVSLLTPISDAVLISAQVEAAVPDFYRSPASWRTMIQELRNNEELLSYYIGFADGSFYQMTRVPPGGTVFRIKPPEETRFALRAIDRSGDAKGAERYVFLSSDGEKLGEHFLSPTDYDPRTRDFWKAASRIQSTQEVLQFASISDIFAINSIGKPGISISAPVLRDGRLVAAVSTNLTLTRLSDYMKGRPVSPNATTLIASVDGLVVAHPTPEERALRTGDKLLIRRVDQISDPAVRAAFARRSELARDRFTFTALSDGREYLALFLPLPAILNKPWEVVVVAPVDDFVGRLQRNNEMVAAVGAALVVMLQLLIMGFARLVSRPLEGLVGEIRNIEKFSLDGDVKLRSSVREVKQLIAALAVMKTALRAFTVYVPREVVRSLLNSGQPIEPGGHSRHLTIMFTDLEGFSSLAETTPAQALLEQVSTYLGIVTRAVHESSGSVDKFIGDAVMAFWGAPLPDDNHAYHACLAALLSKRRLAERNAAWREAGRGELRMRVGIHTDAVLVGNVGSSERMSYTVMGDGVNIASRLEGTNKEFGTSICVSHQVFREAGERLWLRPIEEVTVKGRRSSILVYELLGIRDAGPDVAATPLEQELCRRTAEAYMLVTQGNSCAAATAYQAIGEEFDDALTRLMAQRCLACREAETTT